eukprot:548668-Alexandrium_andersonii.AAC.1
MGASREPCSLPLSPRRAAGLGHSRLLTVCNSRPPSPAPFRACQRSTPNRRNILRSEHLAGHFSGWSM